MTRRPPRYSVHNLDHTAPNHLAPIGSHYAPDGHADSFDSFDDAIAFAGLLKRKTGERIIVRDTHFGTTVWPLERPSLGTSPNV